MKEKSGKRSSENALGKEGVPNSTMEHHGKHKTTYAKVGKTLIVAGKKKKPGRRPELKKKGDMTRRRGNGDAYNLELSRRLRGRNKEPRKVGRLRGRCV